MSLNETAMQLKCRMEGLDIVEYPMFRFFQVFYTFLTLAALPLLLNVQIKHIFTSIFHRNIKIILLMYYSMAALHALAYSSSQAFAIISSLVNKPCDFFPPFHIYITVQLTILMSNFGLVLSLVAICCERLAATIRSRKYESNGIALSLFLIALVSIGIVGTTSYVYKMEDFNDREVSIIAIPRGAVPRFNQVAILNIVINIICIIMLRLCSYINKKHSSISTATLTSRFQTRENVVTTEFATQIGTLQVVFFFVHLVSGIIVRVYGKRLFQNDHKLCSAVRLMCYTAPVFLVVLSIYSVRRLKYYRLHRDNNIRSIVAMESRGVAGARNYEEIIAKAWQFNRQ